MSNTELKPCQYCGDKNSHAVFKGTVYIDGGKKAVYGVRCDNCGYVKLSFISEKDAIKEWNKGEIE